MDLRHGAILIGIAADPVYHIEIEVHAALLPSWVLAGNGKLGKVDNWVEQGHQEFLQKRKPVVKVFDDEPSGTGPVSVIDGDYEVPSWLDE